MSNELFRSISYIPGLSPSKPELLARHLPPIPETVVSTWLHMNIPQGSWILDPFGASPRIALEAARAGYRVLVTANNPIARFLLEMISNPLNQDDLKSALAELAASYVGEERIEPHIRTLYNTICARCGQTISAEAFLWEQGNPSPYARIYTCPFCGDSGEHACTTYDAEQSSKFVLSGLHKARALERVVAYNDQDRIHVEQALSVYNPRALYALLTIINKLQGLDITPASRKHLAALLIYTFDQANSMWRPQSQGERRRQLTIPRRSRENNVWYAMEEGIKKWSLHGDAVAESPVPVTTWPMLPTGASGMCIFEGRMVNLVESIKGIDLKSVCAAIPRPNQAYWTLSALWAGWLWGREAVGSFKSVLHRQRYDWAWHTTALASVFKQLAGFLMPSTPIFGLIGEAEPGFVGSALVAASFAGCRLEGLALRNEDKQVQITWKSEKNEMNQVGLWITQEAIQSAREYLQYTAEPASYLNTITAAFMGITDCWNRTLGDQAVEQPATISSPIEPIQSSLQNEPTSSVIYSNFYNSARQALSYRSGFLQYSQQDETNIEIAARGENIQETLFSGELGNYVEVDDETSPPEMVLPVNEMLPEKERPTRSSDVSESTLIWLRETDHIKLQSLSDRYELFLVNYLVDHPGCTLKEIDGTMCAEFPGLLTPDPQFFRLCLNSYGQALPHDPNRWSIRQEDDPSARIADIEQIHSTIYRIGSRLGFDCVDQEAQSLVQYIAWCDKKSDLTYWFFITSSATISEIVLQGDQPPDKGFIVIPASRTNLLIYKLRRNPRLNRAFDPSQGFWQFIKFRHIRSLFETPLLNRENFEQMIRLDPLKFSTPQLWLI